MCECSIIYTHTHKVMEHLERDLHPRAHPAPITIVDLCSGFGYLSMFLSELLPTSRVGKIVLLDKAWPMHSQDAASAGQINPQHLFLDGWPIRMTTSKNNMKTPAGRRSILKHVLEPSPGPVILLGVHLCGQLSVRAIEMYNTLPKATMLALKPCCLPQLWAGMPNTVWTFANGTSMDLESVGIKGRFVKNVWRGPPRATLQHKFGCWCDGLYRGIACPPAAASGEGRGGCGEGRGHGTIVESEGRGQAEGPEMGVQEGRKESEVCDLWDYGGDHYQNRFLWAYKALGSFALPGGPCEDEEEGLGDWGDEGNG